MLGTIREGEEGWLVNGTRGRAVGSAIRVAERWVLREGLDFTWCEECYWRVSSGGAA